MDMVVENAQMGIIFKRLSTIYKNIVLAKYLRSTNRIIFKITMKRFKGLRFQNIYVLQIKSS